uniref:Protein dead ringer n=1 Tax=Trichogramma kaykai TaxID=54128 RepID=A0ABD2WKI5_9HYME
MKVNEKVADKLKSHQDEELSDPDRQDEESGEELPQQPTQSKDHSSAENTPAPTPLAHLSSLMNSTQPHFLAKIKLENEMNLINNKSELEVLQAAMSAAAGGGGFDLPFSFTNPPRYLTNNAQSNNSQHSVNALIGSSLGAGCTPAAVAPLHDNNNSGMSNNNNNNNNSSSNNNSMVNNPLVRSPTCSHSSESSQGSGRGSNALMESHKRLEPGHPGHDKLQTPQQQQQQQQQQQNQQTSWSFEEQFKQLYTLSNDPERKIFLDNLFKFMQERGTPINRLPIMAKHVLDLYELYNLVVARGGLVDVINKKLWQEIIKGLHLPASITSAAFTLRTQYMKYLYAYECDKLNLSTPDQLTVAIDGNKREGRRTTYSNHRELTPEIMSRAAMNGASNPMSLPSNLAPLQLVAGSGVGQSAGPSGMNGISQAQLNHYSQQLQQQQQQQQQNAAAAASLQLGSGAASSANIEQMSEYFRSLQREMNGQHGQPADLMAAAAAVASQSMAAKLSPTRNGLELLEMSRIHSLWNTIYNNNMHPAVSAAAAAAIGLNQLSAAGVASSSPPPSSRINTTSPPLRSMESVGEPQQEALDLGVRTSTSSSPVARSPKPVTKRERDPEEELVNQTPKKQCVVRCKDRSNKKSMSINMEINGVMYSGVLYPAESVDKKKVNHDDEDSSNEDPAGDKESAEN